MHSTRLAVRAVAAAGLVLFLAPASAFAQTSPTKEEEAKLIATLKSDAPLFEKAKACQRLAVVGTKEAVPVLAGLLSDEQLAHYARFGLEPILDPSVDEALRTALGKLRGKLLVGVINSVGQRRDVAAIATLTQMAGGADPDVAAAAVAALGRIGTTETAKTLRDALGGAPAALRPAVGEACLACAEALLAVGKREEAVALYDTVRGAELPPHVRAAGTRGAIVARQAAGIPLLAEKLRADDYATFAFALGIAEELKGSEVTLALVSTLGRLSSERQPLVLAALGARGDPAGLPAVLQAARGGAPEARAAALVALASLGDASAVPVLLDAAALPDPRIAEVAQATLASLEGKGVDEALAAGLTGVQGSLRTVVIDLVGRRRIVSAVPALRKASEEPDDGVRLAAIRALGETIGLDDVPYLAGRLLAAKGDPDAAALREALSAAARRAPDRDGFTDRLLSSMGSASSQGKCLLLQVLPFAGGNRALAAARAAAADSSEEIRDAATRVLGEWKSEDGAVALIEIVRTSKDSGDRMRAIRAFGNLLRKVGFPREQKLSMCQEAMKLAQTNEERRLALDAFVGVPVEATFPVLIPYLADPALKDSAGAAVAGIAEKMVRMRPGAVVEPLKKVLAAGVSQEVAERARKLLEQAGAKP